MKKTYNAPATKIVKLRPITLMQTSLLMEGNAKTLGIKTADSRSLRYDDWDDDGDYDE